jgi:PGAP1-like protein
VSAPITVRGGSDSIAADFEQLAAFAAELDRATGAIVAALRVLARCLTEPAMISAAVLDPVGATQIAALAGLATAGTTAALAGCQSVAAGLRLAAGSYRAADDLDRRLAPVLAAGLRLPLALTPLGTSGQLGSSRLQARLTADPQLADLAVQLATVAGNGGVPLPAATAGLAGLLASRFTDGTAVVNARPGLPTGDSAGPPRGAADLIRALALRGEHNDGGGAVDVRILDGPAGRRVIVDITGTTVWNVDPRRRTPQVSDLGTNLRALANRPSVFERGVLLALRQAGVRPGEPIMLVGHSQGGMVAARLAGQLRSQAGYTVTHLVTAGSPIGLAPVPGSVSVLSLQNAGDLVPELDGADNPRRGNWITVRTARGDSSVLGKHSVLTYLAGAADLDASLDESLVQWRRSAAGFLTAERVSTQVFEIRRGP